MRSSSVERAVSMITGVCASDWSVLQMTSPFTPGSIRSSTASAGLLAARQFERRHSIERLNHAIPLALQVEGD